MFTLIDFLAWGTWLSKTTHRGEPLEWHMDDLVKRLRDKEMSFSECWRVMPEAADRIERLQNKYAALVNDKVARIEALEAALREIADHWAPSVNEWAMKFKGIASKALEGK